MVKNVTGYDLCKVIAGSYGTLAAMTEVTVKVLPAPEKTRTVLVYGLDEEGALRAMTQALANDMWEFFRKIQPIPRANSRLRLPTRLSPTTSRKKK